MQSLSRAPLTVAENVGEGEENGGVDFQQSTAASKDKQETIDIDESVLHDQAKDEVDKASTFSLYMDKDFRYYFQHPYARLFVAYLVTFCNFLIYAEDPVAHSQKECFIPVVGQCFAFIITKYPPNGWAVVKVFTWLVAVIVGLIVGKLLVHQLLFSKCDSCSSYITLTVVMLFPSICEIVIFSLVARLR